MRLWELQERTVLYCVPNLELLNVSLPQLVHALALVFKQVKFHRGHSANRSWRDRMRYQVQKTHGSCWCQEPAVPDGLHKGPAWLRIKNSSVMYIVTRYKIIYFLWPYLTSSGDRNPEGARLFAPVHTDLGAHPTSYRMSPGSFPGVERPGCGVDHPSNLREVKERVEIFLYSTSGPS